MYNELPPYPFAMCCCLRACIVITTSRKCEHACNNTLHLQLLCISWSVLINRVFISWSILISSLQAKGLIVASVLTLHQGFVECHIMRDIVSLRQVYQHHLDAKHSSVQKEHQSSHVHPCASERLRTSIRMRPPSRPVFSQRSWSSFFQANPQFAPDARVHQLHSKTHFCLEDGRAECQ